jgi:adenylate kinase family enzyme
MKGLEFPLIGTKARGVNRKFDLESPAGRKEYFEAKAGDEIAHIKKYLDTNTFLAYFLGKKSSGKGTYSKILAEIFGSDKVAHVSVGDLVRETDNWQTFEKTQAFGRLQKYYRGYVSFETIVKSLESRSTQKLLPTEFILALVKAKIDELQGKAIFIDGLPRSMDQVSYSLYFREVVGFREDPDLFVLIDIPESVIEERMKYRVVCPNCNTSRNLKLLVTSKIEYDEKEDKFFLLCDNPDCDMNGKARMQPKEGDEKGLLPIRERLDKDEELMKQAFALYGIPKILLRNHVPVTEAKEHFDDYELTPEYVLKIKGGKVEVQEIPWTIKDDNKVECYSLLAPPVVVSFIKQLAEVLNT